MPAASARSRAAARGGGIEFPVLHVRGGTSTGLVISERWAPREQDMREELLRHLMGLPLEGTRAGNKQITGLGRIVPTGNKVFFARLEQEGNQRRIVSTFAQLAADKAAVDWSVNCGNMSAALPLWALHTGQVEPSGPGDTFEIDIFNTNTGVTAGSRMRLDDRRRIRRGGNPRRGRGISRGGPVPCQSGRCEDRAAAPDRSGRGRRRRLRCVLRRCSGADGDRARSRLRQNRA